MIYPEGISKFSAFRTFSTISFVIILLRSELSFVVFFVSFNCLSASFNSFVPLFIWASDTLSRMLERIFCLFNCSSASAVVIFPFSNFFLVAFSFFKPDSIFFFAVVTLVLFCFRVFSCFSSSVRPLFADVKAVLTSVSFVGSISSVIPACFILSRTTCNCVCTEVREVFNS